METYPFSLGIKSLRISDMSCCAEEQNLLPAMSMMS